jgi:dTDP-4-dehydrorhamnose reductase
MKILITGAKGMLGSDLMTSLAGLGTVAGVDIGDFDIRDAEECNKAVKNVQPDCIVNCAAYTAVDKCEEFCSDAMQINALGAENMARAAQKQNASFVQISTDYVYDGTKTEPYTEDDPVNPVNCYGQTKLEAEKRVRCVLSDDVLIVRTAWLFGVHGANFVETIIRIAQTRRVLKVIDDQLGCPTFTQDLAKGIGELIQKQAKGIVHLTNSGYTSWYEFANYFMNIIDSSLTIIPIPTDEYPLPAHRPAYSVLSQKKYRTITGNVLPHWKDAVNRYLAVKHPDIV